jgi:hypothetical protein
MDADKKAKLEAAGWTVGSAQSFLGLSDEEADKINKEVTELIKKKRKETVVVVGKMVIHDCRDCPAYSDIDESGYRMPFYDLCKFNNTQILHVNEGIPSECPFVQIRQTMHEAFLFTREHDPKRKADWSIVDNTACAHHVLAEFLNDQDYTQKQWEDVQFKAIAANVILDGQTKEK